MSEQVDARGLSCPQPVLLTLDQIKKNQDSSIEILLDSEVAKENVIRSAHSQGWRISSQSVDDDEYTIVIEKG